MSNEFGQRRHRADEDFRAADRGQIADLMARFITSSDLGDREMATECFADRVLWDLTDNPTYLTGGPADRAATDVARGELLDIMFGEHPPGPRRFVQHAVSNVLTTFTGADDAEVMAYIHMTAYVYPDPDSMHRFELAGIYHNSVRRDGGRWVITALRLTMRGYDPAAVFAAMPRREGAGT